MSVTRWPRRRTTVLGLTQRKADEAYQITDGDLLDNRCDKLVKRIAQRVINLVVAWASRTS